MGEGAALALSPWAGLALPVMLATAGALALALVLAPVAGWWWRRQGREGAPMGRFVFTALVGSACMLAGATLLVAAGQFWWRSAPVSGTLVRFVDGQYEDSKLRRAVRTRTPEIEFTAPDGTRQRLRAAVDSLSDRTVGALLPLRVQAGPPLRAALAEPAAYWGAPAALAAVGVLAMGLAWRQARRLRRVGPLRPRSA